MEIPKIIKSEIDDLKTPSNRLLVILLFMGFMTTGTLYVTISNSNTNALKEDIRRGNERDLKKDDIIRTLQVELMEERKDSKVKADIENARLLQILIGQEQQKKLIR